MGELFGAAVWVAVLAAVALAVVFFISRWMRSRMFASKASDPFTLQDLRELRAAGQITETEYESMRSSLLGRHAGGDGAGADGEDSRAAER